MERRNSASEQRRCVTELKLEPVWEQVPSGTSCFANRLEIELTSSGAELNKRELQRHRGLLSRTALPPLEIGSTPGDKVFVIVVEK